VARIKATFFFEMGSYGWTETFYREGVLDDTIRAPLRQWMITRRNMLVANASILGARASDDIVQRDSIIEDLGPGNRAGEIPIVAPFGQSQQPFDAVLFRIESGVLRRRSWLCRGVPESSISPLGAYVPVGIFHNRQQIFGEFLTAAGWGFRKQLNIPEVPIGTIVPANVQGRGIVLQRPLPPVPAPQVRPAWNGLITIGSTVIITGVDSMAGVNGRWRIRDRSDDGVAITTHNHLHRVFGTYTSGGFLKAITYETAPITRIQPRLGRKKNTGRPTGGLRGRAPLRAQ